MARIPSANPYNLQSWESSPWGDLSGQNTHINNRNKGLASWAPRLALTGIGGLATAGLGPLLMGGVGAASAGGAIAPAAAGKFTLGSLLGSKGMELGVGVGTSLLAQRSQNKANRYTTDRNAELTREQMRLENERLVRAEAAEAADRADAERRWQAEQAFQKSTFDATEEERAYNRSISDRQLRLDDEREQRRAPYRAASERAMRTLGSILGIS